MPLNWGQTDYKNRKFDFEFRGHGFPFIHVHTGLRHTNCKLYADDVKLYTELKTAADESCFQGCLDFLYSWSVTWQLAISSKKCCTATIGKLGDSWAKPKYCLGVEHISVSDTVSDLGVIVDSHLSFSQHIEKITCKAHQRANLIHGCFVSKQRDLLVKAFITYARPILQYNSPLWSPTLKKDIISIESVEPQL